MLHSTIMQPHQTYVDIWDANHAAGGASDEVAAAGCSLPTGEDNIPMGMVD
ncbi:MAG: hypothetical protein ACLTEX_02505 [Eggerthella lenta]